MKTIDEIIDLMNATFNKYDAISYDEMEAFADIHNLDFDSGETRLVLIHDKWDEVIKIPFFDNVSTDYCQIELENYNHAVVAGIERIFLPIRLVRTLDNGLPIYAQKKYTCSESMVYHTHPYLVRDRNQPNTKLTHKGLRAMHDSYRIHEQWWNRAWQIYGKQFMRILEDFTNDHDIGDLHGNNLGYLGKFPIILDYAGYFE